MSNKIWTVQGTDRRKELLQAYENGDKRFSAQAFGGRGVESFSPDTGFVLLEGEKDYSLDDPTMRRVRACCELSLGVPLDLREFYYTLRQTPHLAAEFADASGDYLYAAVLNTLNRLEVITDTPREEFTAGNLPKGFVFYGHASRYGDEARKVGFTERIAREVLRSDEIVTAQTILMLEKNAAASRLVELGYSELTNTVIATCGGNFSRAVDLMTARFKDEKQLVFMCDGDTWGQDMLRTVEYGSEACRHLADKCPPGTEPNIYMAGMFPSVADWIGLPNDVEDKRPLQNPKVARRIRFQKRYGLIDSRDLKTWERDKTFELEALSTRFKNRKGAPIGLAIYLVEFARLKDLKLKPQPTDDDASLLEAFKEVARHAFEEHIRCQVDTVFADELANAALDPINAFCDAVEGKVYEDYLPELEHRLESVTADDIRGHIDVQYDSKPKREIYSLEEVAEKMFGDIIVEPKIDLTAIQARVSEMIKELAAQVEELLPEAEENTGYEAMVEFSDLPKAEQVVAFYDRVLKVLGAREEDCQTIRKALMRRLE